MFLRTSELRFMRQNNLDKIHLGEFCWSSTSDLRNAKTSKLISESIEVFEKVLLTFCFDFVCFDSFALVGVRFGLKKLKSTHRCSTDADAIDQKRSPA